MQLSLGLLLCFGVRWYGQTSAKPGETTQMHVVLRKNFRYAGLV